MIINNWYAEAMRLREENRQLQMEADKWKRQSVLNEALMELAQDESHWMLRYKSCSKALAKFRQFYGEARRQRFWLILALLAAIGLIAVLSGALAILAHHIL
jgi:hypothetical protein